MSGILFWMSIKSQRGTEFRVRFIFHVNHQNLTQLPLSNKREKLEFPNHERCQQQWSCTSEVSCKCHDLACRNKKTSLEFRGLKTKHGSIVQFLKLIDPNHMFLVWLLTKIPIPTLQSKAKCSVHNRCTDTIWRCNRKFLSAYKSCLNVWS